MKDCSTAIRTAYFTALNNNVTLNSVPVPFYDQVPSGALYPYIYVSDFTCTEETTKDSFGYDATMTIVAVMKYPANFGGESDIDLIAAQVENIIRGATTASDPISFLPAFINVITDLEQTNYFRAEAPDGILFYRTLKFRHRVQEAG